MKTQAVGTRINKIITSKGLTVQDFEKAIGAGNITYPELSSSWLHTGKGSM